MSVRLTNLPRHQIYAVYYGFSYAIDANAVPHRQVNTRYIYLKMASNAVPYGQLPHHKRLQCHHLPLHLAAASKILPLFTDLDTLPISIPYLLVCDVYVASIKVSSVCIPTPPKGADPRSVINKQGSNVDVAISNSFRWWFWYVVNQWTPASAMPYSGLITRMIVPSGYFGLRASGIRVSIVRNSFVCACR